MRGLSTITGITPRMLMQCVLIIGTAQVVVLCGFWNVVTLTDDGRILPFPRDSAYLVNNSSSSSSSNNQTDTGQQDTSIQQGRYEAFLRAPPKAIETIDRMLRRNWAQVDDDSPTKIPFAFQRRREVDEDAVTVAVHADINRLNRLLFLVRRWNGPVSASILVTGTSDIERLLDFVEEQEKDLAWTDIHILMEKAKAGYPHNLLREEALRAVETQYFLALDVDFVTTPNASEMLTELIRRDMKLRDALRNRTWMVLPAFNRDMKMKVNETNVLTFEKTHPIPKNKSEALKMWDRGALSPFHLKHFSYGHGSTDFDKWENGDGTSDHFYKITYEVGFEPYVLGYKDLNIKLPRYWPGFRGYGYNKYTYFVEAHYMGFEFGVLKDFFVVHLPHTIINRKIKEETDLQLEKFGKYLKKKFNLTKKQVEEI